MTNPADERVWLLRQHGPLWDVKGPSLAEGLKGIEVVPASLLDQAIVERDDYEARLGRAVWTKTDRVETVARLETAERKLEGAKQRHAKIGGELIAAKVAAERKLVQLREALEWYAEQSWDTGEVHYGYGDRARAALDSITEEEE